MKNVYGILAVILLLIMAGMAPASVWAQLDHVGVITTEVGDDEPTDGSEISQSGFGANFITDYNTKVTGVLEPHPLGFVDDAPDDVSDGGSFRNHRFINLIRDDDLSLESANTDWIDSRYSVKNFMLIVQNIDALQMNFIFEPDLMVSFLIATGDGDGNVECVMKRPVSAWGWSKKGALVASFVGMTSRQMLGVQAVLLESTTKSLLLSLAE